MDSSVVLKLQNGAQLTLPDRLRLNNLSETAFSVGARTDLIVQGDPANSIRLITSGVACRHKTLADGRRQIVAFMISGDMCDLHIDLLGEMDHTLSTITPCVVVEISRGMMSELATSPGIDRALNWAALIDEAILREWLVNLGQRPGPERIGHLLCELLIRLQAVDLAGENGFPFPLTQQDLSQALGLSVVHVNRSLQWLRREELIVLTGKILTIPDVRRLMAFVDFDPHYLHLPATGALADTSRSQALSMSTP